VAPTANDTAASAHDPDYPVVDRSQHNERGFMMNHTDGWMDGWMHGGMSGWMGAGMWIWTPIGLLVVVLLVVAINQMSKK
jgi:hypothetical protein